MLDDLRDMTSEERIQHLLKKIDGLTPARTYSDRLLIEIYKQQIEEAGRENKVKRSLLLGFSLTK